MSDATKRCEVCDWPIGDAHRCTPGSCSYRPREGTDEYRRIEARRRHLEAEKARVGVSTEGRAPSDATKVVDGVTWVDDGHGWNCRAGSMRLDVWQPTDEPSVRCWVIDGLSSELPDVGIDGCIRGTAPTLEAAMAACLACARRLTREQAEALGMTGTGGDL